MSLYPPPSANVPVFNPALFTNINSGVSYGSVGVGDALAFPVAQGAEIWTNGTSTATLDSGTVSLTTITGVTLQGITLGANGFSYNDGVNTTTGLWTKVQAVGALSSASNATTLNVNNTIQIQNGETTAPPSSFIALETGSNQLQMNLCQNGTTPSYGSVGNVLTSGGPSGSMYWGSGGGGSVGTLQDVLNNGSTSNSGATFTFTPIGNSTTISGMGLTTGNSGSITTNAIDSNPSSTLSIGSVNAENVNIKNDLCVIGTQVGSGADYVSVDKCYFTVGVGGEATIDTKNPLPLYIAPPTTVEPTAVCSELVLGNNLIPVTVKGDTVDVESDTGINIGINSSANIQIGPNGGGLTPLIVIDTLSTANTNADPAIAIGTSASTKTIKINNGSSSVHCSSVDLRGSTINNITGTTGALSIGNLQTDGILNIGTLATRTATGAINIGNTANASPIDIAGASVKIAINGSYGTAGNVLTSGGSGGTMTWAPAGGGGSSIQRGETAVASMNSTSGTVTYASTFATKPYVVLSFNTNGGTTFIPIGVVSHQTGTGGVYTGFTWGSASTSATATITWYATI